MADPKAVLATVLLLATALPMAPLGQAQDGDESDLVLEAILLDPPEPDRDQDVTLQARIADAGNSSYIGSYTVLFRANGDVIGETDGSSLDFGSNDQTTKSAPNPFTPGVGPNTITVQINASDSNSTNNVGARVVVLGPDLSPTSIETTPEAPKEGDEVSFEVTVENSGAWGTNGTAKVSVAVDGTSVAQDQVDALAAGESATVSLGAWTAQPGTHDLSVTVNPSGPDQLNETDTTNNTLSADPLEVTETDPNLEIAHIVTQPVDPAPGDTVTIQATVRNTGDEVASSSKARLFLDGDAFGSLADIDALDPGQQAPALWQWDSTLGVHQLGAVADAEDDVTEADEQDNERNRTLTVGPDLTVLDLRIRPESPVAGDNVTAEVDLANLGRSVQSNVTVALTVDGTPLGEQTLEGLAANATETLTFGPVNATPGEHTVTAVIDPDDSVEEADPGNNEATRTFDVGRSRPDLTVTSAALDQRTLAPGETARFTADIANDGGEPAPETTVRFAVDGTTIGDPIELDALETGQTTNVTSGNWTAQAGAHTLTVTVDPGANGGQIEEEDEEDNRFTLPFAVGPDLSPTEITLDPSTPRLGENVTVTTRIENRGTQATGVFQARLTIDGETIDDATADGLAARETITVEHTWQASDAETLEVNVDVLDDVDEVDEENNRRQANLSVDTSVADLRAGELTADPTRPTSGENVTFQLNLTNEGDTAASAFQVSFRVNGTEISTSEIPSLEPGETTNATSGPWAATQGGANVTAVVDPDRSVYEADRADNLARLEIQVEEDEGATGIPAPSALAAVLIAAVAAIARQRSGRR